MQVASIFEKVMESRLSWFGHIQKREENHCCKLGENIKLKDERRRGRPETTWADNIKSDLVRVGSNPQDALNRDL